MAKQIPDVEKLWAVVKKIRSEVSFEKLCNQPKTLYIAADILSNIEAVENQLEINSSETTKDDMLISTLQTAGEIYLYLNSCPENLKPWFLLYTDIFQSQSVDKIILNLNRILKVKATPQNKELKLIAEKLFRNITSLFSMKYQEVQSMTSGQGNIHGQQSDSLFNFKGCYNLCVS